MQLQKFSIEADEKHQKLFTKSTAFEQSIKNFEQSIKNETTKSEATFSEVLKFKHIVSDMAKSFEGRTKAIENTILKLKLEISKKQASFEQEFTGNFEMIKDIVLHTDQ